LKRRELSLHYDDETKRKNRAGIATWVHHDDVDDDDDDYDPRLPAIFSHKSLKSL
jgi:hypothetical protein